MTWPSYRLDELGTVSRGRSRHRPRDAAHLFGGPYPFIQTADVKHAGLYITTYGSTYSEAGLAQSKLWPAGTLCITIAANIADTSILGIEACFPDSVIGFIPDPSKADARFIKYAFDATLRSRFRQFTQGATQDNLSQAKLLSVAFTAPGVDLQRRVADAISSYDDLISNIQARTALLEDAARRLHFEWFTRLRFPGYEHTPVRGGVPDGWTCTTLGKLCDDVRDAVLPHNLDPGTPYIGLEHMPRRSITLSRWGSIDEVTSTKLRFRSSDIIFGKIRPYFHKVGIALSDGVASSDAIVVRVNEDQLYELVLGTLSSDAFVATVAQRMREGSKMPRADWKQMQQYRVVVPPSSLLGSYREIVQPIVAQLRTLGLQSRKLLAARDFLLPHVMSGRIAI